MQIDRIYFPVKTLGYGKRIGIWTIGCTHGCPQCSNPELWAKDNSKDISISEIIECVNQVKEADGVTITGGDPFEQPDSLLLLVEALRESGYRDIIVYSGYTYDELLKKGKIEREILENIGILVDGLYKDDLNDNKSIRGSSNQRIIILDDTLSDRYRDVENWERETQIVMSNNSIQAIGLPIKKA